MSHEPFSLRAEHFLYFNNSGVWGECLVPVKCKVVLMGKRELVGLLGLSSWCLVMVERLFLPVLWGCLLFVSVVFPDHTHLLFFIHPHIKMSNIWTISQNKPSFHSTLIVARLCTLVPQQNDSLLWHHSI